MSEADRVAARRAAAQRALQDAEKSKALGVEFDEYRELAPRLKRAVPKALAAEERRNYEGVVQVHGNVRGWAPRWAWWEGRLDRSTDKDFGAFELFSFDEPIPWDDYAKRRVTVYLTSSGDIAYGDNTSHGHVTVRSVDEYLDVFRKDLDKRAARLKKPPHRYDLGLPKDWDGHLPNYDELLMWRGVGLRKVVEAVERLGGGR